MSMIRLPDALAGAPHATVVRWRVAAGQTVAAEQVLVDLETAEALVQVRAPVAGVLGRIIAQAGMTVKAGAELGEMSGAAMAATPATVPMAPATPAPAASGKQATPILMPQAGNTMEEGRIVQWRVKAGDAIKEGQILCEIETDKSTIEFESPLAGTIAAIVVGDGQSIAVKKPIAFLNDGDVPSAGAAPAPSAVAAPTTPAASGKQATPILMPQAGNTMEEGRIVQWRVKAGDAIKEGQILCEIETDKSTIEFESPLAGTIAAIVVGDGQSIAVKKPIAYLNDGDIPTAGAAPAPTPVSTPTAPAPTAPVSRPAVPAASNQQPAAVATGNHPASPAARRLAKEQGLDLASVGIGSGPGGRILSTDLAKAVPAGAAKKTEKTDTATISAIPPVSGPIGEAVKRPLSRMRKAIATNLQQSKQTVPHFYVRVSVDAGRLLTYAKGRKADAGCSVNDVVVAALGRAIHEFPALRSRLEGDAIVEYPTVNIGIAVGMDDGLVVPVVMQVERLTLAQLAAESRRVVENARKGKLENLGKAVFSVSNLGMFGVEEFSAIINPPEAGILAVSAAREAVIVKDGALKAGRLMTMTLSADHRVVDGLLAAKFVARLKEILEAPEQIA